MSTATQKAAIKAALEAGRRLTPLDALREFHCFRLGARIFELREEGLPIVKEMVERCESRVAEYRVEKA